MAVGKTRLGATGSSVDDLGSMGALSPILNQLGGGEKAGRMAMDYARQMYPDAPEADPWEAALRFFLSMGQSASQPGATLFSSGFDAAQAPLDYLNAKKKEAKETKQARMQTALQLAPSLKAPVVKATYGKPDFYMVSKQNEDGTFTDPIETALTPKQFSQLPTDGTVRVTSVPKSSTGVDNTRMDVILKGVTDNPSTPMDERITSIPRGSFDPTKHLPVSALPKDSSTSEDNTLIDVIDRSVIDDPLTRENEQIKTIKRSEFDSTKHVQVGAVEGETLNLEEVVKAERELRNEYVKRSDDFKEASRNYATIKVSQEQANGPGDVALITSFMKMLDPGSVVRETEFANARDTAGLLESLGNALKKAETGEFLNPTQRAEFTALAQEYLYAAQNQQLKVRQSLGLTVQNYGLTASNVFGVEVAPAAAYLNSELINIAIDSNQTVDKLWSVMSDAERERYGG